jgi:hypothetical protein
MYPGHLTFNIYNVNIFAAAEDPTSLVTVKKYYYLKHVIKY